MKKAILTLSLAMAFAVASVGTGFAATVKCVVDSVDGDTVTMTCKKADKLEAGDKVKVKSSKKGAAIEGC